MARHPLHDVARLLHILVPHEQAHRRDEARHLVILLVVPRDQRADGAVEVDVYVMYTRRCGWGANPAASRTTSVRRRGVHEGHMAFETLCQPGNGRKNIHVDYNGTVYCNI
jgi:hypothetical protein